jgi:hypothetical protein
LTPVDTDRVLQPQIVDVPDKPVDARTGVAAHQHLRPDLLRQLSQRRIQHRDLIGGVVGGGLAWAQHRRQWFAGAAGAVVNERQQWVKTKPALEVGRSALFLRVRTDQGGVQVNHHQLIRRHRAAVPPHRGPHGRACPPDRGNRGRRILAQGVDEPADRGIRGHRAEQLRLGAEHRGIGQTVTAECDRDRQVQHRLARIVHRACRSPWPQRTRQFHGQTADLRRLQQQRGAARRNQRLAARFDTNPTTTVTLHLRSAFQLSGIWTFDKPIFPCWTGTSVHHAPNKTTITRSLTKDRG